MKNVYLILKILASFVLPITSGITIFLLTYSLPDSLHLIEISSFAFFFAITASILFLFEEKRFCRYPARVATIFSVICWCHIYYPVFFIYHISKTLVISMCIFYFLLALVSCILANKQHLSVYGWIFISICTGGYFNLLTLLALCYSHRLYSIFLFLGSTSLLAMIFYYILDVKKYHFRNSKVVRYILLTVAQLFLSASTVLMIF